MVNFTTAENALKSFYLDAVTNQLNTNANPFLARIKQLESDVWGKDIRKLVSYGINGGIGAGLEDGELPKANPNKYAQFVLTLKNLYGTIEITDKAIRASENNAGAFVNLLNAEMEGLVRSSALNLGRMLFGNGSGILGSVSEVISPTAFRVSNIHNFLEGQVCEVYSGGARVAGINTMEIIAIDRRDSIIHVLASGSTAGVVVGTDIVIQGSHGLELTGLEAIFDTSRDLYGLERSTYRWLSPYETAADGGAISEIQMQSAIDFLDENSASQVDFILCSSGVKRAYQEYLSSFKRNIDIMNLEGGYKAISYNGIPVTSDRFCPRNTMYLLNSKEFNLHQLCDWQWLQGEDGRIIKQLERRPIYTATLVKYADLICNKPVGQARIIGITER
ncbi:MAG: phage major capsid protein [Firmicutes bacterium]|nr:phage major capsid protein [Bacillota bacterium]